MYDKTSIIIPARYNSTRFPGKPLALICGKPMIQHVYERARQVANIDRVIVATEDDRIAEAVSSIGGEVFRIRPDHANGTEAVTEVAATLDSQVIVNIQGDTPYFHPSSIEAGLHALNVSTSALMATLKTMIRSEAEYTSPHTVKVVTDHQGYALYFSRSPIPHIRGQVWKTENIFKHIGVYIYTRAFLLQFPSLPKSPLEETEQLEQLRALERRKSIAVGYTAHQTVEVDIPEDIKKAEQVIGNEREI